MDIHFDPKVKEALARAREDASFSELALATGFEYLRKYGADLIEDADHRGWYRVHEKYYPVPQDSTIHTNVYGWNFLEFPKGTIDREMFPQGVLIRKQAILKVRLTVDGKTLS